MRFILLVLTLDIEVFPLTYFPISLPFPPIPPPSPVLFNIHRYNLKHIDPHQLYPTQNHLGIPIQQFCYPSGEPFRHGSLAARRQIVALLAADGYVGATTDPGLSGIFQNSQAPFALLRIRVDGRSTPLFFIHTLPW